MILHYPVPQRTSHSMLWLMVSVLLIVSMILALRAAGQPVLVELDPPDAVLTSQPIPQALPVPEPPHNQPAPYPHASNTAVPPTQVRPAPQPVPTPPAGQ